MTLKYGFVFPFTHPRTLAQLAADAEAAGWDGIFVADTVWGVDPWVSLAAAAMTTQRLRLGTMLTPLSRCRPWTLAGETSTLDQLSAGRVILSAGLGAIDTGFENFGEVTDRRERAELLDEGLDILTGLWHGQPYNFNGKHYHIRQTDFIPALPPVQTPRIPIWVVGMLNVEKSMQRVMKYDGLIPNKKPEGREDVPITPDDIRAVKAYVAEHRTLTTPFDIIMEGRTNSPSEAKDTIGPLAEAGITWWNEAMWTEPNSPDDLAKRIRQGPPRLD